jgi:phosphonate transport system substrate-binding protein
LLYRDKQASGQHEFDQLCAALEIEHRLTRPRTPQTNGMAERFNDRNADILKTHHFMSGEDLEQTLRRYCLLYNEHLPQTALGGKTPLDAMNMWYASHPQIFLCPSGSKHPGCDSYTFCLIDMSLRSFLISLFHGLCVFMFVGSTLGAQEASLRLGIAPFTPAKGLFTMHQSLLQHLERQLGRSVKFYTSTNHAIFLVDSLNDRFDIVITPPHFGVLCLERDYVPLARYRAPMTFLFVVRAASGIKTIDALRGKRIAFPEHASFFATAGVRKLEERGMRADRDYRFLERPNHAAAIFAVDLGDADAAVTTYGALSQSPVDVRSRLKIVPIEEKPPMPHLMTLARARLGPALIERIQSALNSFPGTDNGKAFFRATGYEGYTPITEQDIQLARPYTDLIRYLAPPEAGAP